MYVLTEYVRNSDNARIKKYIQTMFRQKFMEFIKDKFEFYTLKPIKEDLKDAVEHNFKLLIGKIYKPSDSSNVIILALDREERFQSENITLLSKVQRDFYLGDYELGNDLEESSSEHQLKFRQFNVMYAVAEERHVDMSNNTTDSSPVKYEIKKKPTVLFGIYKSKEHKDWILRNMKYNVRLGNREGAIRKIKQVLDAEYLVLYNPINENDNSVYRLGARHEEWDYSKMKEVNYPLPDNSEYNRYFIYYLLEESKELGDLNVSAKLKEIKEKIKRDLKKDIADGAPIYIYKNELSDNV